jgi:hypothetical protein
LLFSKLQMKNNLHMVLIIIIVVVVVAGMVRLVLSAIIILRII